MIALDRENGYFGLGEQTQARGRYVERFRVYGFLLEQIAGDQHEIHPDLDRVIYDIAERAREIRGPLDPPVLLLAEVHIGQMDEPESNRNTPVGFSDGRSYWKRQ